MNRDRGIQRLSALFLLLGMTILACQGVAGFNPFATATPTPTLTFTPSPTPSPTPTPLPTHTPTPTPLPTGTVKEKQPDGATLFTDYEGNYQLTFPEAWTVVILEEGDIEQALDSLPDQEKNVSDMIESIKSADVQELIRVVSFNFGAQEGVYTPNINISYDTNPLLSAISLKDLIDVSISYYPALKIDVMDTEVKETSSGLEIGVIKSKWSMNAGDGKKLKLQQEQIFFKSGEGVVVMTLSTLQNAKVDLSADLDKLIESIRLLD